jgi:type IV pilus assembly protein PilY1
MFNAGVTKPITGRPQVGPGPYGSGMVVLFGTGKYVESADRSAAGASTQTFFGIYDTNNAAKTAYVQPVVGNLQQQTVVVTTTVSGQDVRVTSANSVGSGQRGWYMNLPTTGERQVSDPVLRNGRIVFTTLIPSTDPCSFGGSSWLMDLDALSGKRLQFSPFDLNNDGQFDLSDLVVIDGVGIPVSGLGNAEILSRPAFVSSTNQEIDYAFTTDTGGDINRNRVNPGPAGVGRQSWRQLR